MSLFLVASVVAGQATYLEGVYFQGYDCYIQSVLCSLNDLFQCLCAKAFKL